LKKQQEEFYPVALTIAGSDSGGGAGIQADLRTFNAAGVYGCSVITAVTAQNPRQVAAIRVMDPEIVQAQIESVLSALAVKAIKTGMLGNAPVVKAVSTALKKYKLPLIVDPVMISSSGSKLLDEAGLQAMIEDLLPLADLITPNLPEAEFLLGKKLADPTEYAVATQALAEKFQCNCLLKTGHALSGDKVSDIAVLDGKVLLLTSPRVHDLEAVATHGTGCTLSSAITAMTATGSSWRDALYAAKAYVYGSLCETAHIGKNLDGMYPPLEDYSKLVSLRSYQPAGSRKGKRNA